MKRLSPSSWSVEKGEDFLKHTKGAKKGLLLQLIGEVTMAPIEAKNL